ncbi:phosphatase PAP2 family protein [Vibrio hepatarius]|nr:phosphatase PAP2 family protein [Vibrio hepatarius]MBU2899299.1 phosphatase PAP2 family protein [Vibrio hepatarius]
MALSLMASDIDLFSPVSASTGFSYTALTFSAGPKGFIVSLVVLAAMTWRLTPNRVLWMKKMFHLGLILAVGFICKTALKQVTESPRPYTEVLTQNLLIPQPSHFYNLSLFQKQQVIEEVTNNVSTWRTNQWQGEKDFSFPSGHTIFVAICLAFFGNLFLQNGRYLLTLALSTWAMGVAYSRLWLGMHRPIDLLGSVVFVLLVYILSVKLEKVSDKVLSRCLKVKVGGS